MATEESEGAPSSSPSPSPSRSPSQQPQQHEGEEHPNGQHQAAKPAKRSDLILPVCRDFTRGRCSRPVIECRYAHPPSNVAVDGDEVTVCFDSLRDRCARGYNCRYFHPPPHLRVKVQEAVGIQAPRAPVWPHDSLNGPQMSHFPFPKDGGPPVQKSSVRPTVEVCRDFVRGRCARRAEECRYAHHTPGSGDADYAVVCQDYLRGSCQRPVCRFFHVPDHLKSRVKDRPVGSVSAGSEHVHQTADFGGAYGYADYEGAYGYNGDTYQQATKRLRMDDYYLEQYYDYPYGQGQGGSLYQVPTIPAPALVPPAVGDPRKSLKDEDRLPVCRDFYRRGDCSRGDGCRFVHPEPHIEVVDNHVTICRDSVRGRCSRDRCRFYHPGGKHGYKTGTGGIDAEDNHLRNRKASET